MKSTNYYFGVSDERFDELITKISAAILRHSKTGATLSPSELKYFVAQDVIGQSDPVEAAMIGIMIEQAYNAAVKEAMSKNPLSRIFKK